jgi:hypothetical protein
MEVNVRGEGVHLTLEVLGYESDRGGRAAHDANWLSGAATIEVTRPPAAVFRARCSTAWQTTDFLRFHEALRTLLDDLTGVATFSTIEDQVEITVRLHGGKGRIAGRIEEHALATLEFDGETDQSYLLETLSELRAVTTTYPIRH